MSFLTLSTKFAIATFSTLLLAASGEALAQADLSVTLQGPASPVVYQMDTYTATVRNIGSLQAAGVTVQVDLPLTATSPQVYILGELSNTDARCQVISRTLRCSLGSIRRSKSASFSFGFKLPQAAKVLSLKATAATTTSEPNTNNNSATITPSIAHPSQPITADLSVTNAHCTGSGTLSSYFECLTAPSSISQHDSILLQNGEISFPDHPEYGGSWELTDLDRQLTMEYTELGLVIGTFAGWSVGDGCYEGKMNFESTSSFVAIYRVCPL